MADRALGNPLGNPLGLARTSGASDVPEPLVVDITSGTGEYIVPVGYRFMRVTAVGAGSSGAFYGSLPRGGGGGSVGKTVPIPINNRAVVVAYEVGEGGVPTTNGSIANGGDTKVEFLDYKIVAGGGKSVSVGKAIGGTATGADYNYSGGTPGGGTNYTIAGGAAGLFGDAYAALSGSGAYGSSVGSSNAGGGGGGIDGNGGRRYGTTEFLVTGANPQLSPKPDVPYKTFPGTDGKNGVAAQKAGDGGAWGGGGGGAYSSSPADQGKGGNGGVRIELW